MADSTQQLEENQETIKARIWPNMNTTFRPKHGRLAQNKK